MIFSTPLAALGLLSAAALVAVYCLRRKSPPRPVGSLLLWPKTTSSAASASRRDRLRLPPSFWLELLIILSLVLAALSPLAWRAAAGTLHVVLDTSPSMSAGDARARAEKRLENARARGDKDVVRVREARNARELSRAVASLSSVLPPGDEIAVLTDAPPQIELPSSGLVWESFGERLDNAGIVAARRRRAEPGTDVVFAALRVFGGGSPSFATLRHGDTTTRLPLSFDAEGRAFLSARVPSDANAVSVSIPKDAFPDDDKVILAKPRVPSLAVAVRLKDERLRSCVVRALDATGCVARYAKDGEAADLTVVDGPQSPTPATGHVLRFAPAAKTLRSAPVWCDPVHPIMDGVTFDGEPVAPGDETLPGVPVAVAGERTLVSAAPDITCVAFDDPDLPFFRTPSFPALVQNVAWAAGEKSFAAQDRARAEIEKGNLLDADESDLSRRATTSAGSHASVPESTVLDRSLAWIPALVALAAIILHLVLYRVRTFYAALALVCVALARPVVHLGGDTGTLVAIVDRSASLDETSLAEEEQLLESISSSRPDAARLAVVSFGADAAVERPPSAAPFGRFEQEIDREGSSIAAALAKAELLVEKGDGTRFVVVSDGLLTGLDEADPSRRIDVCPLAPAKGPAVSISRIDAPRTASPREAVPITAWIESRTATTNDYVLTSGTNVISKGTVVLRAGLTPLAFRDIARAPGLVRYTLTLTPSSTASTSSTPAQQAVSTSSTLVKVEGRRPLLWLKDGAAPSAAAALARSGGVDVREADANEYRGTLSSLQDYGGVVIENVPAKILAPQFQRDLVSFATDFGGGLAMTGGEHSFGPGGWHGTSVEDILPVSLELRDEHRKYALALAIVLDRSGSMTMKTGGGRTKMEMANLGAAGAIGMLTPADEVAVFAVDCEPHRIVGLTDGASAQARTGDVRRIRSEGGGIFVEAGVMAALKELEKSSNPNKHVILFADASDAEEPGDFRRYLGDAAKAGVTLSVIALGHESDCDAQLVKDIASVGNGECFFEADADEIPRLFMQDTYLSMKSAMVTNPTAFAVMGEMRSVSDAFRPPAASRIVGGYNLAYLREDASLALKTLDDESAPLLAFRMAGLGRTMAYTGELLGGRSGPLMSTPDGASLASAIARWTLGEDEVSGDGFIFEEEIVPGGVKITAVTDGTDDTALVSVAGLPLVAVKESRSRGLVKESPVLEREDDETLSATVPLKGDETLFAVAMTGRGTACPLPPVCLPSSPERRIVRDPREGARNLARLAERTGGAVLRSPEGIWSTIPSNVKRLMLDWIIYLATSFLVLLLVIAKRLGWKIALFSHTPRSQQHKPSQQSQPPRRSSGEASQSAQATRSRSAASMAAAIAARRKRM